jgi:hypothetical protein
LKSEKIIKRFLDVVRTSFKYPSGGKGEKYYNSDNFLGEVGGGFNFEIITMKII